MAADIGLIKAAKDAYRFQSPSFGKALSDPIKEGDKRRRQQAEKLRLEQNAQAERLRRERRAIEEAANREIRKYINEFPPGIPLSKIPEKYRPVIQEFLFKEKKIYSDAVSARANMQAGSDEYQEQTDIMNNALQAVANLKSQWDLFGQGKEDNINNRANTDDFYGNYSKSNSLGKLMLNAALFTDKLDALINDDGDLFFDDGQGGLFKMTELELPTMKAAKQAQVIQSRMIDVYNNGKRLNDKSIDFEMGIIRNAIEDGGIDVLKSLAVDNLVANVELFSQDDEIFQRLESKDLKVFVDAKEELTVKLLQQYAVALKQQAEDGYRAKNPTDPVNKAVRTQVATNASKILPLLYPGGGVPKEGVPFRSTFPPTGRLDDPEGGANALTNLVSRYGYRVEYYSKQDAEATPLLGDQYILFDQSTGKDKPKFYLKRSDDFETFSNNLFEMLRIVDENPL